MKKAPEPRNREPRNPGTPEPRNLIAFGLLVLVALSYAAVRHFGFAPIDDAAYVSANPHVLGGLTWANASWAFTSGYASNWHPLTWLSYMAEVQCFGLRPEVQHVTNVLLHAASTLLLFGWLRRTTRSTALPSTGLGTGGAGAEWRSACVAALFAVHPLHVESVAWIAERKDVLSTLFWMLSLWAYTAYVERPRTAGYVLLLVTFACGLMAKPMVLTLPLVLLLLDVWPLGRVVPGSRGAGVVWRRLLREKVPLLLLSAVSALVTFLTQQRGGAMNAAEILPLGLRVGNAALSVVLYLWQTLWPVRLVPFYVHPDAIPLWQVAAAVTAIAGVSILVLRAARHPFLAVGWFWYLVTLAPVAGVVQVGMQARADRYTYIPLIGIFIAACWGVPVLAARWGVRRPALMLSGLGATLVCAVLTRQQAGYWQDGVALWGHAVAVTEGATGIQARYELAKILTETGRPGEAVTHLNEVIRVKPEWGGAHGLLGMALVQAGRNDEAKAEYATALRLDPALPEVENNFGAVLANEGRIAEAMPHFAEAVRQKPGFDSAQANLGVAFLRLGRKAEAIQAFQATLRINPDNLLAKRMLDEIKK